MKFTLLVLTFLCTFVFMIVNVQGRTLAGRINQIEKSVQSRMEPSDMEVELAMQDAERTLRALEKRIILLGRLFSQQ
ncbi:UvrABC system protein C [Acrasis kona]|uniref:UvrABC system protein C n=1 Tax=Acrasis kona TaxID=1008807 RepID=A0AAW2ZLK9_9EUKA